MPQLSEYGDPLSRLSLCEFGDALRADDQARLEEYQEVVNLESVSLGDRHDRSEVPIRELAIVPMLRIEYNMICQDRRLAESGRQSIFG